MSAPAGPGPEVHLGGIRDCVEAGCDEVYIGQAGGEGDAFFEFYANAARWKVAGRPGGRVADQ